MSNFLSKVKVKTALQAKRNKFDLSCAHVSTSDFYQNVPIYCHEMIPKETIKVHLASETRCAPLVNPTFGHIKTYYRAFFVPYRTIYPAWNDFIEGTTHRFENGNVASIPSSVPRVQLSSFYSIFITQSYGYATVSQTASNTPDFKFRPVGSSTDSYITLTAKGRLVYKILVSLGYKFNWTTFNKSNSDASLYVSALPILSFAKIWCDWYQNPQYDTTSAIEKYFLDLNPATSLLTPADLATILDSVILLTYDLDYFTSAWDNPTSPNPGNVNSNLSVSDISLMGGIANNDGSKRNDVALSSINNPSGGVTLTPVIRSERDSSDIPTSVSQISQYILDALHSVTDFVTRYKMVGSRALDRYLAEYGIQLSSEKLKRSVYLGKFDTNFNIGDVTQTSPETVGGDTLQIGVGSYTGKMIGGGDGTFEYSSDEYGMLIITAFIVPRNNYVYGRPRYLSHMQQLDFFKGDFDALGCQAIRQDELVTFATDVEPSPTFYSANGVFGFTPRYAEYKVAQDNLSGDFLLASKNQLLDGWYMARKFDDTRLRHTASFCYADGSQYNNIWQDGDSGFDHFFVHYIFNVEMFAPMKTLFDMYDYSNEDGRTILANLNGTNVNS